MRAAPPKWLEKHRVKEGRMRSDEGSNYGFFTLPVNGNDLTVIISGADDWESAGMKGIPFEHVSVSLKHRCPTWNEMHYIKRLFWEDEETVLQYHPPKSQYRNVHKYCLHLWKPIGIEIPVPDVMAIG